MLAEAREGQIHARSGDQSGLLLESYRSELGWPIMIRGLQEMQRSIRVVLGIEDDIETSLDQCQAKQFALAGAVFDQEDGGVRHHYIGGYQQGMCRARR